MDTSVAVLKGRRSRRRHSAEFKAAVIDACRQPGVSIAAIALANGLNANMLRKWVVDSDCAVPGPPDIDATAVRDPRVRESFIAIATTPVVAEAQPLRVEIQRGSTSVTVIWPMSASTECAAWLREVLR